MPKAKTVKPSKFAHKALQDNNRRPLPSSNVKQVDEDLSFYKRPLAYNSALELEENLALVGWAIRTWLSFTASFKFQANTGNDAKNAALEAHVAERTRAKNCDVQRSVTLWQMLRAYAGLRVLFGHSMMLKAQGGKLQHIEGWQIAKGKKAPKEVNDTGLVMDAAGLAVEKYAICRGKSSVELEHWTLAPWEEVIFDKFGMRPSGFLGVSPLLPAMDTARYYMTASEFYWFKIKIASMFGVAIFGEDNTSGNLGFNYNQPAGVPETTGTAQKRPLQYDLKPGLKLHLSKDSRAEFLESKSPPAEFLAYAKHSIRLVLSSLNLPYSLYDSEGATYSAQRADFNLFKQSALEEREKNQQAGHDALEHLLRFDDAAGTLPDGLTYDTIDWELVPTATFILDLSKEVDAYTKLIGIGARTHDDVARELGSIRPYRDNIRIQGEELEIAKQAGVPLIRGVNPGAAQTGAEPANAPADDPAA
jgi:hypothetical protein